MIIEAIHGNNQVKYDNQEDHLCSDVYCFASSPVRVIVSINKSISYSRPRA